MGFDVFYFDSIRSYFRVVALVEITLVLTVISKWRMIMPTRPFVFSGIAQGTAALVFFFALNGCDSSGPDNSPTDSLAKGHVDFTHLPVDLDDVTEFIGLGAMQVFPKDHGGFFVKNWDADAPSLKPVYAPANGIITLVDLANFRAKGDDDLAIRLDVSSTIYIRFGHVDALSENILSQIGSLKFGENRVSIAVSAGEQIGWIGQWQGFDMGIIDKDLSLDFVHPERYPDPQRYAGYYFDYFKGSIGQQLLSITVRTIEPRGGKIDYDIRGRIIGNWFLEGTVNPGEYLPFSGHMSIAYGYLQGDQIAISDAYERRFLPDDRETSGPDEIVWIAGDPTSPETVGEKQGLIKYEYTEERHPQGPIRGVFLIQLVGPERLRFERFAGKTADSVNGFTATARIYLR